MRLHILRKAMVSATHSVGSLRHGNWTEIDLDTFLGWLPDRHCHLAKLEGRMKQWRALMSRLAMSPMWWTMWPCLLHTVVDDLGLSGIAQQMRPEDYDATASALEKRWGLPPSPAQVVTAQQQLTAPRS